MIYEHSLKKSIGLLCPRTEMIDTLVDQVQQKANIIVGFYNCVRRHSALGNIAPLVYEKQFAAKQPIAVSEIT